MKKNVLSLIFVIALITNLSACNNSSVISKPFSKEAVTKQLENGDLIAENANYILEWSSKSNSVALTQKESGLKWGITPSNTQEEEYDALGMPKKKNPQLLSAVIVEYTDEQSMSDGRDVSYTAAVRNGRVGAEKIENGVHVEYYFDTSEIMIPVDYILRNDSVEISVNTAEIQENNKLVTSVALAPFWCSSKNDEEDSYLFYPSGSGALIYSKVLSQTGIMYSSQVFGEDAVTQKNEAAVSEKAIRLPVYGSKSGDMATLGIIERGAESAEVEANVGSSAIGYSAVYAKFRLRSSSSNTVKSLQGYNGEVDVYVKEKPETVFSVGLYPLTGASADYSGMAARYKDYLKERDGFERGEDTSLNVTIVGGTLVNKSFFGIPYKSLLPATTLSQAKDIIKDLKEKTDMDINARLIGFGSSGLDNEDYAGDFKISKNLGNKKELSELNVYCLQNDINLYFDFDLIKLKNSGNGFSNLFDSAYSELNKIARVYDYEVTTRSKIETSKYTLLKRELLNDGANKLLKAIKKWDIGGISLSSISNTAYSDYSDKTNSKYFVKGYMAEDATEIISKFKDKYNIASSDANIYSALQSDIIYDTPNISSKERIFDEDIPFYQMIFKGYTSIATENINTASNYDLQLLKAVESGSGLGYLVTEEYYNNFIDYHGYEFFNSKYDDIQERIYNDCEKLKDYYNAVNGAEIVSHKIMKNGLRETVFDNGVKVYVNYSEITVAGIEGLGFKLEVSINE